MLSPATPKAILLDVNGTLTDPATIGSPWGLPDLGGQVLELAVRGGMTDALLGTAAERTFSEHVRAAIEVLVAARGLDPASIDQAATIASALPARPGAHAALSALRERGIRLVALTNSGAEAGEATLDSCGLLGCVERVLGVDAIKTFKPHPDVYRYALDQLGAEPAETALLATHPWDLAGAHRAGIRTAWVTHGAPAWPKVHPRPDWRGDTLPELARAMR